MSASTAYLKKVLIENTGTEPWPANGHLQGAGYVNLAYRWFDDNGRMALEGDRVPFPEPLKPGDKIRIALRTKTPATSGQYRLLISPVQEGVQWFENDAGEAVEIY